jgi:hypothetical protein
LVIVQVVMSHFKPFGNNPSASFISLTTPGLIRQRYVVQHCSRTGDVFSETHQ